MIPRTFDLWPLDLLTFFVSTTMPPGTKGLNPPDALELLKLGSNVSMSIHVHVTLLTHSKSNRKVLVDVRHHKGGPATTNRFDERSDAAETEYEPEKKVCFVKIRCRVIHRGTRRCS